MREFSGFRESMETKTDKKVSVLHWTLREATFASGHIHFVSECVQNIFQQVLTSSRYGKFGQTSAIFRNSRWQQPPN
jgi:hypothetical protein